MLRCPSVEMNGFLLQRNQVIRGYFILGKTAWEGRIMDMVVDSDEAEDWRFAYAAATIAAMSEPEVCRIRTRVTLPMLSTALAQNGYWQQYKEPIVLHDPNGLLTGAFPVDFQLLDGDAAF